jgi:hypothetical protein
MKLIKVKGFINLNILRNLFFNLLTFLIKKVNKLKNLKKKPLIFRSLLSL